MSSNDAKSHFADTIFKIPCHIIKKLTFLFSCPWNSTQQHINEKLRALQDWSKIDK